VEQKQKENEELRRARIGDNKEILALRKEVSQVKEQ